MPCTYIQADFGSPFTDVDPVVFGIYVELAKSMILGPAECQVETELAWRACCVDVCAAIGLVIKHLIASDPNIDEVDKDAISERVGDVSVTWANVSSGGNPFSDSAYGRAFGFFLRDRIRCKHQRQHFPPAVRPTHFCGGHRGRHRGH